MKKKVLIVATVLKIHIMVFHLPTIKMLHDMGYEVHVCARNDYNKDEKIIIPYCDKYFDLPFERFPLKYNNLYVLKKIVSIIKLNNYDFIHCHTPSGGLLTRIAAKIAKTQAKILYTAHGFHFYKGAPFLNWLVYFPVEWILSYFTDIIITINKEDYELAKNCFLSKKVYYTSGVGIDISKYADVKIDKNAKKRELGIPENSKLILSVGELNNNKNHQVVLKALAKINNTNLHYAICGSGNLENHLIQLAKKLKIEEQFHLLGQRKDVPEILKCGDIFVFPSLREGLGLAALEAMASGLPLIISDNRGSREFAINNYNSLIIEAEDIDSLKKSIITLLNKQELKEKFLSNSSKIIEKFSVENVCKLIRDIYNT